MYTVSRNNHNKEYALCESRKPEVLSDGLHSTCRQYEAHWGSNCKARYGAELELGVLDVGLPSPALTHNIIHRHAGGTACCSLLILQWVLPLAFGMGGIADMWLEAGTCDVGARGPVPEPCENGGVTPGLGLPGKPWFICVKGSAGDEPVLANRLAVWGPSLCPDTGGAVMGRTVGGGGD
ncbi:hypothetical protein MAR_016527 [Mya arenaria]|uniref:Uncharacterized protein n=1 Tax=Mya arenaria TaxID=6604 RepID=A0ABY7FPD7_MYAAR|nr:hypothetical protein MAR_016527 [Mya arenaria]